MAAKKTILVVDDNVINHKILCKILRESGYSVLEAMNGKEALAILNSGKPVSLILLDLVMPVMSGLELLKVMNETGMIAVIPVIVLTGNDRQEMEIQCLQAGASDFLKKPYNAQLVRHRVGSILRLWDNAMLVNQLETDRLTGLYNKECFYRHAEELLEQFPDKEYMVLYLDIEEFKMINVHYGTQAGDELLRYIGNILKEETGEAGLCGRIGADIFGIIRERVALQTQEKIGKYYVEKMKHAPVKSASVKCGVYMIEDRTMTVASMIDCAKIAETSVKHHYGLFYAVYDNSMSEAAMREHQLANYMEEALEKHQFVVYLQPKHNTENDAVAGAEALVRWVHPELGFISPGEFIPLFERNGFIVKLDYFVWEEVCRALRKWMDAGIHPVPISVNASRADFSTPDLPEQINNLIDAYQIPPELLHVEVTESAYTDNPQQIIAVVSTLRDMGFEIEMDDFGSGYSSLNMLSELPIDILKLDMRFMQSGNERLKGSKRNILSFIVSLSKWLQLTTVAEGVETKEEVEALKSMGCNLIQGYFYARPMPIADFATYLSKHLLPKVEEKMPDMQEIVLAQLEPDYGGKPLVLVVEDIESNRKVMQSLLAPQYRIVTAENGAIAYDYIKENSEEISCILLDLLMPIMDGFQLLDLLHRDNKLSEIPVIITTETGNNGELRALNLGAHSFVAKPYNPDVLRHHVRKAVEERTFLRLKREYTKRASLLYEKAYRDELTGFLNRYGLKETIQRLPKKGAHTVILMGVNRLKETNETFGHVEGDQFIATVASLIQRNTRSDDILARIRGDEFAIILCGMGDGVFAQEKAQKLCQTIADTSFSNRQVRASCSAGVAVMETIEQYDVACQHADDALYPAKKMGEGTCKLWQYQQTKEKS